MLELQDFVGNDTILKRYKWTSDILANNIVKNYQLWISKNKIYISINDCIEIINTSSITLVSSGRNYIGIYLQSDHHLTNRESKRLNFQDSNSHEIYMKKIFADICSVL